MGGQTNNSDWAPLIEQAAGRAAFGRPVLMNTFRAVVAEVIVGNALGDRWVHCATDYHPYDFERDDGVAVEVKQSAALQSWAKDHTGPTRSRFDIAERTGRYVDDIWIDGRRRYADIYIFAHHPRTDRYTDHRQPGQWDFYVVPACALPGQASLGLNRLMQLAERTQYADLSLLVNSSADNLKP